MDSRFKLLLLFIWFLWGFFLGGCNLGCCCCCFLFFFLFLLWFFFFCCGGVVGFCLFVCLFSLWSVYVVSVDWTLCLPNRGHSKQTINSHLKVVAYVHALSFINIYTGRGETPPKYCHLYPQLNRPLVNHRSN